MKQKKSGKKLNLNKKTIAVLDIRQINAAYGGIDRDQCITPDPISCPPPQTQDPTATVFPRHCPCCF